MTSDKIILEASTFPRVDIDFMNNTHFDELVLVQQLGQLRFNTHVNTMDLMTVQFAVMNGYSPNSAPSL